MYKNGFWNTVLITSSEGSRCEKLKDSFAKGMDSIFLSSHFFKFLTIRPLQLL